MKQLFKFLMVVTTMLFFSCASNAQDKTAHAATVITDSLKSQLTLNEAQYTKAYNINLEFIKKAKEIKDSSAGRREKMGVLKEADAKRDAAMKEILTEKQYQLFLEKKAENRKKMKETIKQRRG